MHANYVGARPPASLPADASGAVLREESWAPTSNVVRDLRR